MYEYLNTFFDMAEIVGTVAFAASGAMLAIDRELDMFGVMFLGVIAAVGGGVTRDLLLGIVPPTAFRNPLYVMLAVPVSIVVFLFAWRRQKLYQRRHLMMDQVFNLFDAVGLGLFGVIGVEAALARGHADNMFLCVFMGMTTGVGGGILRDLLSLTIPSVLKKHIYAIAVITGSCVYYLFRLTDMHEAVATVISMAVTIVIRVSATYFHWDLPSVHWNRQIPEDIRHDEKSSVCR